MSPDTNLLPLENAIIVIPDQITASETRAVAALVEEIELRTHRRLAVEKVLPPAGTPAILVGQRAALKLQFPEMLNGMQGLDQDLPAEGFTIHADAATSRVVLAGQDARGVLYAVGRLLRSLVISRQSMALPLPFSVTTSPHWPLRGHQLGYRPLPNSYTGWDLPQWERYIRELALWGANAIELLPPNTGGVADSPHFPLSRMEMMVKMAEVIDSYGLDVWVWYPQLGDYSKTTEVDSALREWEDVLSRLCRVNAIFVPGGDPGKTPLNLLIPLLEKQIANARRLYPQATLWLSPQGFKSEEMDAFFGFLSSQPDWLTGVVFGPQVHLDLADFRDKVPSRYPIRYYPDITHTRHCQYPVPDWDLAFALTQGREPTCPRPEGMANILWRLQPHTIGAICYSEGCHDDVNKAVWSALSWDPQASVIEVLRDYARFFIDEKLTDPFAQGLLALERNWQGALLTNEGVYSTLQSFQEMEQAADPHLLKNWRFQQPIFRAYCDAYTRLRLIHETSLEEQALDALREAEFKGACTAMDEAEKILDRAVTAPVGRAWRTRIFQLAEALYQTIHHKLSVSLYHAQHVGRGAHLDSLDWPLNNRLWLKSRFAAIRLLPKDSDRLAQLAEILNWTNPGPGGFYDNLGALPVTPRLERGRGATVDPAFVHSSLVGCLYLTQEPLVCRTSWMTCVLSLNGAPLRVHYDNLDPLAEYEIRIVYSQAEYKGRLCLVANETCQIHDYILKPDPMEPLTFDIPAAATHTGDLQLAWKSENKGNEGYGCAVAELWLMRKDRADLSLQAKEKWRYANG
ncbi:MAG TPA: hypothetical protein DET40_06845 [Lentisphaeria bacterium]|nr:MAG: hypothetical protein A2X45_07455 [Lentisphaerae bacterium GWF2_50_93]HCE43247.1 hypothetical protein [Lentisphaeria bacterium]